MNTASTSFPIQREPELFGQTVVVIGGSARIGLETARRARVEGAKLILTGRNPERLQRTASELHVLSTAAFDATDPAALDRFFHELPTAIDHLMVTAGRTAVAWQKWTSSTCAAILTRICCWYFKPLVTRLKRSDREARCCSWEAPALAAQVSASRSRRHLLLQSLPSQPTWRSSSRPSEST
jgi:NAD(P)-dependent dehydrogenase (short-subunit alcohol dehydrogenase family)